MSLLLILTTGHGQKKCTLTLSGRVQNKGQEPLPKATVALFLKRTSGEQIQRHAVCDQQGNFLIANLCRGRYDIEVHFLGYKTLYLKQQKINQSLIRNFLLTIDYHLLDELVVEKKAPPTKGTEDYMVISGKELEENQQKTLGKLLSDDIAGVSSLQTGPSIFKPMIHGVHSQRILIINNHLPLASQQWGAQHAPEIDPFSAHSLTVIKDAGGIKYGPGALGGVIVIQPKPLPDKGGINGRFNLTGESNGISGLAAGMIDGGFKKIKGLGWRVQGKIKQSGDFNTPNYVLSNTGLKEYNYLAMAGFHNKRLGIEASFSSFNTQIGILRASVVASIKDLERALESDKPLIINNFTYSINNPQQYVTHNTINLSGHYQSNTMRYRLQYGLQINKRSEFDIRRGGLNNIPAIDLKLTTHSIDLEIEQKASSRHSRCFGANGTAQTNFNIPGTQRIPFIPNYTSYSVGIYDIEYFKRQKTLWEVGIRYDYQWYNVAGRDINNELFRSAFNFHSFSGILGINYFANQRITIYSNLGMAWRPPGMAELYSMGLHQGVAAIEYGLLLDETTSKVKNRDMSTVNNEQAIKWTLSLEYKREKWHGKVSGYVNYIFNYIYLRPRGITRTLRGLFPYFRYTQTDASFIGADIVGKYTVIPSLNLQAKIAWLHATDETFHDQLIYIPSNRCELRVRYEKQASSNKKHWFVAIKAKYVMKQYRAPKTVTVREINNAAEQSVDMNEKLMHNFDFLDSPNGYFLAEFNAGIIIPIQQATLSLTATVSNPLNTTYREYTNRMRYYADELGRNFTLTLQYKF